jgi:hypothetical protein
LKTKLAFDANHAHPGAVCATARPKYNNTDRCKDGMDVAPPAYGAFHRSTSPDFWTARTATSGHSEHIYNQPDKRSNCDTLLVTLVAMGRTYVRAPIPQKYDKDCVRVYASHLICNFCGLVSGPLGHMSCERAAKWRAQDSSSQQRVCAEADKLRKDWKRREGEAHAERLAKDRADRLAHEQYQLAGDNDKDESSWSSSSADSHEQIN